MAEIRVHDVQVADEGRWQFRDSSLTWCPPARYGHAATFDPFPAYPHQRAAAEETVAHAQRCCPPLWDVDCYLTDREEVARSNGHSNVHEDQEYVDGEWVKKTPTGLILLSGKRIPPHPAMTRYLIGHEYGHNVAFMLNHIRGAKHLHDDDLYRDYAATRGLPDDCVHHGEGGNWHTSAAEIFACDFRIIVCGIETEFWPHPRIGRPENVPGLDDWWAATLGQLDEARAASDAEAA
jgi:hypothetical protein